MASKDKNNNENQGAEMSFLDHIEVLRWHLVRSAVAIVLASIAVFIYKDIVVDDIILGPRNKDFLTYRAFCALSHWIGAGDSMCFGEASFKLVNPDMSGQFTLHIWISIVGGLILTFPYVLWEMWRFIKPALHDREMKPLRGFVLYTSLLFILGVLFSYYLVAPLSINFLGNYELSDKIENFINVNSYISTITTLTLACGIVFELPIIIYFLTLMGLMSAQFMRKYRRHAVVIILIIAAIVTPSPDISSQVLVAIPLYGLYELSIVVSIYAERRSKLKKVA